MENILDFCVADSHVAHKLEGILGIEPEVKLRRSIEMKVATGNSD